MSTPPAHGRPPLVSGWQLVALVALVLGALVGALLLVAPADRIALMREVGGMVAPYAGTILAAGAAVVAAYAARATHKETARQTPMIETAVRQTNGALTKRDARIEQLEAQLEAAHARRESTDAPAYDDVPVAAAVVTVNTGPAIP